MSEPMNFYGTSPKALQSVLKDEFKAPSFVASQLLDWCYQKGVTSFYDMTNIKTELREKLAQRFSFDLPEIVEETGDKCSTMKLRLRLSDKKQIETVLMREDKKATICVSSQVGCAQKCSFCATGSMGFKRNLTAAEIVGQIVLWKQILSDTDFQSLRVVYMGMGEPFHNLNQVFKSLEVLTDAKALNIGARRITVSTSGVTKGIFRLLEFNPQIQLAISLHTVNEKLRRKWIQGNSASVEQLLDAASQFAEKSGRKVTFEVVVFGGQNFLNTAQINRLARELEGIRCSINLIPFNPHDYCCDTFEAPERDQVLYVQKVLKRWGYEVTVRYSKGKEIQAACGQLVAKTKDS